VTTYVYTAIPAGDGNSEYRLYPVYLPPERDIWWEAAVNALATYEPKKSGRYSTLWTKCALGKDVDKVTANADLITVHFRTVNPNLDLCALSPEAEEIRRQQLAWTMHDASNFDAPVVVTVGEDNTQVEGPFPAQEKYLGHLNTE
jgi:hypothetical protein